MQSAPDAVRQEHQPQPGVRPRPRSISAFAPGVHTPAPRHPALHPSMLRRGFLIWSSIVLKAGLRPSMLRQPACPTKTPLSSFTEPLSELSRDDLDFIFDSYRSPDSLYLYRSDVLRLALDLSRSQYWSSHIATTTQETSSSPSANEISSQSQKPAAPSLSSLPHPQSPTHTYTHTQNQRVHTRPPTHPRTRTARSQSAEGWGATHRRRFGLGRRKGKEGGGRGEELEQRAAAAARLGQQLYASLQSAGAITRESFRDEFPVVLAQLLAAESR